MTKSGNMAMTALVLAMTAGAASAHDTSRDHGDGPHGMGSMHDMMESMMAMHGATGTNGAWRGMMMQGGMPMTGSMRMMGGMQGMAMMDALDADGDGIVTPDEARTSLDGLRTEYDADGDGSLSLAEFETLHSALIRETMVDRFQYLDADGDGMVTADEMTAPADRFQRMQSIRQRMMQGYGDKPDEEMMPGQSRMMDGDGRGMQGRQGN